MQAAAMQKTKESKLEKEMDLKAQLAVLEGGAGGRLHKEKVKMIQVQIKPSKVAPEPMKETVPGTLTDDIDDEFLPRRARLRRQQSRRDQQPTVESEAVEGVNSNSVAMEILDSNTSTDPYESSNSKPSEAGLQHNS